MSLCINPQCQNPDNPDTLLRCQGCGSELLLEGRYRVMCLLGEGGFAKTYEVSDRTNTPKVLKVLSKNEPKPVEQFQREAQISSLLGDFIDQLMARSIQERPPDTQTIVQRLVEINQTLYPRRLSRPQLSNSLSTVSGQNIALECTLGNWYSSGHADDVAF